VDAGLIVEPPDQMLEFSGFLLYSCVDFLNTSTWCSMKCL
jgi:hypothetical protein